MTRAMYDRTVPSDGLTRDSAWGPVDLVAVERVEKGHPAPLTRADDVALSARVTGSYEQAEWIAWALGVSRDTVLRRVDRARKRAAVETTC